MTASWAELPPPRDDDDDDVAWALQTAQVQWKRGSPADAIVWLRRAADSAMECGARSRANELKLAAQHLTAKFVSNTSPSSAPPASSNPFLARDSLSDDVFGGSADPFADAAGEADDGLDEIPIGIDDFGGEIEDSASRFAGEALRRISTIPPARGAGQAQRTSSLPPSSVPPPPSVRSPTSAPPAVGRQTRSSRPPSDHDSGRPSRSPSRVSSLPPPRLTPLPPTSSPSPSETELSLGLLAELESDAAGGFDNGSEPDVLSVAEAARGIPLEEVQELDAGEVTEIDPPDVIEHLSELPPAAPGEPSEQERERELRTSLSEELAPDLSKELESIESARDRGLRPSLSEELARSLPPSMRPRDLAPESEEDVGSSPSLADDLEPSDAEATRGLADDLEPSDAEVTRGLADDLEPEDDLELEDDAEDVEEEDDDEDDEDFGAKYEAHLRSSAAPPRVSSIPAPKARTPNRAEAQTSEPSVRGVSLLDVEGLEDLPEPAQIELARAARIETLAAEEELNDFGVALVTEGTVRIMPTIAEAVCGRASKGDVVFTRGTLEEGVLLRVVADEGGAEVAVWDSKTLAAAMKDCPWVDDELRVIADRFQALAGAALGAMGERLDDALRALVTDRCDVVSREAGEALLSFGQAVDGMYVVGAGRVELVDEAGKVLDELSPGDFLFAPQVMGGGAAPSTARAGLTGALLLKAPRSVAHELMLSVPPLLEILAG